MRGAGDQEGADGLGQVLSDGERVPRVDSARDEEHVGANGVVSSVVEVGCGGRVVEGESEDVGAHLGVIGEREQVAERLHIGRRVGGLVVAKLGAGLVEPRATGIGRKGDAELGNRLVVVNHHALAIEKAVGDSSVGFQRGEGVVLHHITERNNGDWVVVLSIVLHSALPVTNHITHERFNIFLIIRNSTTMKKKKKN